MLKQSLTQKQIQKLSPQQIQLMKLLQVPTLALDQRIKEELEINPALEEGEDFGNASEEDDRPAAESEEVSDYPDDDMDEGARPEDEIGFEDYCPDYASDEGSPDYRLRDEYGASDEEEKTMPVAVESSFQDHLEQQMGLLQLNTEQEHIIARQILGSIDEDGYLRREPLAILDDLSFYQELAVTLDEVLSILRQIQTFDPPGTGARNLQECLSIQLHQKLQREDLDPAQRDSIDLAIRIIDDFFDEFSKKHYTRLERALGVEEDELKDAVQEILRLNPKPASGFSSSHRSGAHYVIPDFIVVNRDGELDLTLNSRNAPDLRISDHYRDMLQSYRGRKVNTQEKEAILFIKQKIDSAKWFIDAIRQRQETMYHTMYAILQFQQDYFLTGDAQKLRPMILKDIADRTGFDISTISRVANSKFVQTEFGTKSLKEFFSEGMQTQDGEEVSTLEVKKILSELIGKESKRKPLSDEKLTELLTEKGYNIARRTVAKYREQLNIPVARLRKEL